MCHKDLFGFFPSHHYIPRTYNIEVTHKILVGCPNDKKSRYSFNIFHPPTRLTLPSLSPWAQSIPSLAGLHLRDRPYLPSWLRYWLAWRGGSFPWVPKISWPQIGSKTKPETFQARLSCWVKGPDWAFRETQVWQRAVWAGSNYLQIGVCRFHSAGGLGLGLTLGQKK